MPSNLLENISKEHLVNVFVCGGEGAAWHNHNIWSSLAKGFQAMTGNHTTGNRTTGNLTTGNRTTGNLTTGNRRTGNRSTGIRTTGNRTSKNHMTRNRTMYTGPMGN